eukprot:13473517-Ditylum_brightwellii.AAC.1
MRVSRRRVMRTLTGNERPSLGPVLRPASLVSRTQYRTLRGIDQASPNQVSLLIMFQHMPMD